MSLRTTYTKEIIPKLEKELGKTNPHAIPRLTKIVVNVGMGTYMKTEKNYDDIIDGLKRITSQAPVVQNSRKSVSNFKLQKGKPNGAYVTLRGQRMYDFFERLVHVVFPRIRDFRGFSPKAFDGQGNYSLGIKEHLIFPEIPTDKVVRPFGLQITVVTNSKDDLGAKLLLENFQFPFRK